VSALTSRHGQPLAPPGDRCDEPAAVGELRLERVEPRAIARGRDVDRVERRLLRQPARAVADRERDVLDPGPGERFAGDAREVGVALDRPDVGGQRGEDRGVVAGAGADVEDAVVGPQLEQLGHAADDERLGDRLPAGDAERGVVVGVRAQLVGHERLARHGLDRPQDALVGDVVAQLGDEASRFAHRITA